LPGLDLFYQTKNFGATAAGPDLLTQSSEKLVALDGRFSMVEVAAIAFAALPFG